MSIDEQKKRSWSRFPEAIQVQAETRAKAAVAEAAARARNTARQAETRARERIAEHQRRMQELARMHGNKFYLDRHTGIDEPVAAGRSEPDFQLTRDAISRRAYHKAERRGFEPGGETEDWLQAERELLAMHAALGGHCTLDGLRHP